MRSGDSRQHVGLVLLEQSPGLEWWRRRKKGKEGERLMRGMRLAHRGVWEKAYWKMGPSAATPVNSAQRVL